ASASVRASLSTASARRALRAARHSSQFLASQTVQVTSEANTRPTITIFTRMSALRNMPHGDRSRGSKALAIVVASGAAGVGAAGVGAAAEAGAPGRAVDGAGAGAGPAALFAGAPLIGA